MRDKAGAEVGSPGSGATNQMKKKFPKKPFSAVGFWTTQGPTMCVGDLQFLCTTFHLNVFGKLFCL